MKIMNGLRMKHNQKCAHSTLGLMTPSEFTV